jgi:hypothetical protein
MGLVCLAMLAKHSFGLPRSDGSHWISQTCKIRESRLTVLRGTPTLEASLRVFRHDPPRRTTDRVSLEDAPPAGLFEFLGSTLLRAPPSAL